MSGDERTRADPARGAVSTPSAPISAPTSAPAQAMQISPIELEAMLTRAAQQGAKQALADVGLEGKDAALDIRDLRSLLDCVRFVRRTAVQTTVHLITTGLILALLAGIALKLRIFGSGG
ncbi:DUF6127 family protein [Shimia litoralis]|nr:DUF6127 family protein [Shimia litoralis]